MLVLHEAGTERGDRTNRYCDGTVIDSFKHRALEWKSSRLEGGCACVFRPFYFSNSPFLWRDVYYI